jgi:hypothetical protein
MKAVICKYIPHKTLRPFFRLIQTQVSNRSLNSLTMLLTVSLAYGILGYDVGSYIAYNTLFAMPVAFGSPRLLLIASISE